MDLDLNEEERLIQAVARELADREIAPRAAQYDATHAYPWDNVRALGAVGLLGVAVPETHGGSGATNVAYVLALEEIARACASTGTIMSVANSLVCWPLATYGREDQQQRYLPRLTSGAVVGAFALSEPQAGSDAANQQTTAVPDGDAFVLNGTKNFITNGGMASVYIVFARTSQASHSRGISAFLVEADTPGLAAGPPEQKLGIRASATTQLALQDCRVPRTALLGQEGEGLKIALSTLDGGRIGIAAQAVGIARAALEASVRYAAERIQFDRPIGDNQGVQWLLADMATEVSAARWLTLEAAHRKDQGRPYSREAAMAKLFASAVAVRSGSRGVQVHGGYGYLTDFPVERFYRDAKITEIYEGTSEVQRIVIARDLLHEVQG